MDWLENREKMDERWMRDEKERKGAAVERPIVAAFILHGSVEIFLSLQTRIVSIPKDT